MSALDRFFPSLGMRFMTTQYVTPATRPINPAEHDPELSRLDLWDRGISTPSYAGRHRMADSAPLYVSPVTPLHGTKARYAAGGCRCGECCSANTIAWRKRSARVRAARVTVNGDLVTLGAKHGTVNAYRTWECRCPACRRASAADTRARKLAKAERMF